MDMSGRRTVLRTALWAKVVKRNNEEQKMSGKETVVLLVHGANQARKSKQKNEKLWNDALSTDTYAKKVLALIDGEDNQAIAEYHAAKHPASDYPAYGRWVAPWYGSVWKEVSATAKPFGARLNGSANKDEKERTVLLERIQRKNMRQHFDELVPFYELAVRKDNGETLYESICKAFLDQLIAATEDGEKAYVLVGHSMGCAVTYNVMTHISCAAAAREYCPIDGALSSEYRQKVADFAAKGARCFGLLTFGNYTGYNWCQRLNHKLLFGEAKETFVYPDAVGRWYNFWTVAGGDPYIIDDRLSDTMVDGQGGRYDDVAVFRVPGSAIGHGRGTWFGRKNFSTKLREKMAYHLYT